MSVATSKGVGGRGLMPYLAIDCKATISGTVGQEGYIKATGGRLYYLDVENVNAVDVWIQLFDTDGAITVGSTVPKLSLLVPASDGTFYSGRTLELPVSPILFENNIRFAITTSATGAGAATSNTIVNALYK